MYTKIKEAIFLERPNRFIAKVLIDGLEELVHVKNTGRCRELLLPGAKVILEDCGHRPNRKTRYSLIGVYKGNRFINMDSQVPNRVVFDGLKNKLIPGLEAAENLRREVTYGSSRFDIAFDLKGKKGLLEVKGVTLERDNIGFFPDAPTERGTKHTLDLISSLDEGYLAYIVFLIQMESIDEFRLNWKMDETFSKTIYKAHKKGVNVRAFDSKLTPNSIVLNKEIPINFTE